MVAVGAIVGIAIGGVVILAAVAGFATWLILRRQRRISGALTAASEAAPEAAVQSDTSVQKVQGSRLHQAA